MLILFVTVRVSFLDRLFEFRRLFHSIAAGFDYPDDTVAVVCWVDHVFARLGNVPLVILRGSGANVESAGDSLFTIAKHIDESALHAAAQLPRTLTMVDGFDISLTPNLIRYFGRRHRYNRFRICVTCSHTSGSAIIICCLCDKSWLQ